MYWVSPDPALGLAHLTPLFRDQTSMGTVVATTDANPLICSGQVAEMTQGL